MNENIVQFIDWFIDTDRAYFTAPGACPRSSHSNPYCNYNTTITLYKWRM